MDTQDGLNVIAQGIRKGENSGVVLLGRLRSKVTKISKDWRRSFDILSNRGWGLLEGTGEYGTRLYKSSESVVVEIFWEAKTIEELLLGETTSTEITISRPPNYSKDKGDYSLNLTHHGTIACYWEIDSEKGKWMPEQLTRLVEDLELLKLLEELMED